jgi:hypothetical protein
MAVFFIFVFFIFSVIGSIVDLSKNNNLTDC